MDDGGQLQAQIFWSYPDLYQSYRPLFSQQH